MEASGTTQPEASSARGFPPLVEAMMRPGFYPDSPVHVEFKQTHISYVFVAGDFVYKVKKPIHFAFLDCSRLAQRFHYCCEEVRLNTRLSPRVYLGVFAILKSDDSFKLGPEVHAAKNNDRVILRAYRAFSLESLAHNRRDLACLLVARTDHKRCFAGPKRLEVLLDRSFP